MLILACTIGEFSLASPPLGRRGGPPAPAPPPSASTTSPQPPPVARSFGGRYPPGPPSGPPSRGDRPHGIPRPPSPVNTPAPPQGRGVQVYPLGRVVGQRPGGNDNGNRNGQADRRDTRPVDPGMYTLVIYMYAAGFIRVYQTYISLHLDSSIFICFIHLSACLLILSFICSINHLYLFIYLFN